MRILIGYDGSECADAALRDLHRAGLPPDSEALIMSVADVFQPPPIREFDDTFPMYVPAGVRRAHEHATRAVAHARDLAEKAGVQLKTEFPGWDVSSESCAESPAWALIQRADAWKPDFILVGSHGHTALGGRIILGSVSQRILYEARSSVRVARGKSSDNDLPVRILIGMDGSPDSFALLDTVAIRHWPNGSEVRLLIALDSVMFLSPDPAQMEIVKWFEVGNSEDLDQLHNIFDTAAEKLRKRGLTTSVTLMKGNPKHVLVDEAESWGADSIFLGARGARGVDRFLLGSVSAAVAARAHCSVEVVRQVTS